MDLQKRIHDRRQSELYEDGDDDPAIAYPTTDEVMKEDWDDPKMADYDQYEKFKRLGETIALRLRVD